LYYTPSVGITALGLLSPFAVVQFHYGVPNIMRAGEF